MIIGCLLRFVSNSSKAASLECILSRLLLRVSRLAESGGFDRPTTSACCLDALRPPRLSNAMASPSSKCATGGGPRSGESVRLAGSVRTPCSSSKLELCQCLKRESTFRYSYSNVRLGKCLSSKIGGNLPSASPIMSERVWVVFHNR